MTDEICLTIPAQQDMLLVARMALAGLCARCGADCETLEDIRTACDEACYCLMHQPFAARTLTLRASTGEGRLCVVFTAERGEKTGRPLYDVELARGILSSLVSRVRIAHDGDGVREIELTAHVAPL